MNICDGAFLQKLLTGARLGSKYVPVHVCCRLLLCIPDITKEVVNIVQRSSTFKISKKINENINEEDLI